MSFHSTYDSLPERLKRGDVRAYEELYNSYYKSLVVYCYNLTKDQDSAEDIVQQTLLNIWSKRDRLEIQSSLKSYLYRAVHNTFVNEYRKLQKEDIALLELQKDILIDYIKIEESVLEEKIKLLELAIDQLPPRNKEVFLLSKKWGHKHKEIAARLGISEKAVEKHIGKATQTIKKWLKGLLAFFY